MNATVRRPRGHSYASPEDLAKSPVYQYHRFNGGTGYPEQHTPYIQPSPVKQENYDEFIQENIKGSKNNLSKDNVTALCSKFEKTQCVDTGLWIAQPCVDINKNTELATRIKTWFQKRNKDKKDVAASSNSLQLSGPTNRTTITESWL
jgi:hypothetical protein